MGKLGSGGFGTVRLARLKVASDLDNCKSDGASTQEDSDSTNDSPKIIPVSAEEEKVSQFKRNQIARKKSGVKD